MPEFEFCGALPIRRVLSPLARLLRGVARREALFAWCIAGNPRGQELARRIETLLGELCRPAA